MANDYKQFFKAAKQKNTTAANISGVSSNQKPITKPKAKPKVEPNLTAEQYLRQALQMNALPKQKSKGKFPFLSTAVLVLGICIGVFGYFNQEQMQNLISRVNVSFFANSLAQDATATLENIAQTEGDKNATSAVGDKNQNAATCVEMKGFAQEELSHFNKLSERKNELDLRERDLLLLEEELHKQKAEIETRIGKLEQIREEVATVLLERVEMDQQRVSTLVDFYSNMKPQQAADIIGKLNEDLAVEVLGKMKKKSAADILNLVEPVKARTLSEKFTGYVRR